MGCVMSAEEIKELKQHFAAALLKLDDPAKAAFAITDDTGLALQIMRNWPTDAFVQLCQKDLLANGGAKTFLPSKEQQAKDVYKLAEDTKTAVEDRLKAHRLYAEIMQ